MFRRLFHFSKVPGAGNPAGLGTKGLAADGINRHIDFVGGQFCSGRPALCPKSVQLGPSVYLCHQTHLHVKVVDCVLDVAFAARLAQVPCVCQRRPETIVSTAAKQCSRVLHTHGTKPDAPISALVSGKVVVVSRGSLPELERRLCDFSCLCPSGVTRAFVSLC